MARCASHAMCINMSKRREKLVFKGEVFSIYQWRQKLYDGTYATFERADRQSIVQIIPTMGRKIAIALEEQPLIRPTLGILGGLIECGERPLAAAKRELLEESGMVSGRWKRLRKFVYTGKVRYTVYLYAAIDCRKVAGQHLDPGERIEVRYTTLRGLLGLSKRIRTGEDVRLYLTEIKYEPKKRKALEKLLFGRA